MSLSSFEVYTHFFKSKWAILRKFGSEKFSFCSRFLENQSEHFNMLSLIQYHNHCNFSPQQRQENGPDRNVYSWRIYTCFNGNYLLQMFFFSYWGIIFRSILFSLRLRLTHRDREKSDVKRSWPYPYTKMYSIYTKDGLKS